jgi:adenylate cyclase
MDFVPFPRAYAPESNLEILTNSAESSGFFSLKGDRDAVVRWMPLAIQGGEEIFPPLALLMAWHYLERPQLMVRVGPYGIDGIQMGERFIPTDESGQMLVNYRGPAKTFPHVSISDILGGRLPSGTFEDKIVLVGASATGTYDMRSTPFGSVYPGAEIHATVIDNILTRSFLSRPNWSKVYDLLAIVLLSGLIGLALPRVGALVGLLSASAVFALHIVTAGELFVRYGLWLNIVYPLLAVTVSYTALTVYYYITEERERKKIKGAFGHYVAPEVVEEMLEEPGRLELGGEQKILTVLFSDLQGFTSYSERYSPQQMIELLGEYYARMTEQVFAYRGMLKEYVGDELMAIFGAPVEQADHAERACTAALAMREHRNALSEEWVKVGRPRMFARTGVNSGPMLVGNLGSKYRFSYGVLGDDVNLGSRLEGMNKAYATEIIIGENTAQLVGDAFRLREMDLVRVVGKQKPTRIYELLGASGASLAAEQEAALRSYAAGLEAYRQQAWVEAQGLFKESLARWPGDGPSRTMVERCQIHRDSPPPEDWDGVFEATKK